MIFGDFTGSLKVDEALLASTMKPLIHGEEIGDEDAPEDISEDFFKDGRTAARSNDIQDKGWIGKAPQPPCIAIETPPCFVHVQEGTLLSLFDEPVILGGDPCSNTSPQVIETSRGDLHMPEVFKDRGDLPDRKMQAIVKPEGLHRQIHPNLRTGQDARYVRFHPPATSRAIISMDNMADDTNLHLRNILDIMRTGADGLPEGILTMGTSL